MSLSFTARHSKADDKASQKRTAWSSKMIKREFWPSPAPTMYYVLESLGRRVISIFPVHLLGITFYCTYPEYWWLFGRGCSQTMSAKNGGSRPPSPGAPRGPLCQPLSAFPPSPFDSYFHHFSKPPSPLRQLCQHLSTSPSLFSVSFVNICNATLFLNNLFFFRRKYIILQKILICPHELDKN